jgi:hypothetical protein
VGLKLSLEYSEPIGNQTRESSIMTLDNVESSEEVGGQTSGATIETVQTQEESTELGPGEDTTLDKTVSAIRRIRLERQKKLSGAQKKKLTKEKKMAEGTWIENIPKKPPPIKPSDENNSTVTVPRPSSSGLQGSRTPMLSSKRQHSEDNTPVSDQRKLAKRARSEDRPEYRDALCIKMAVIWEGFPNEAFTDDLQFELLNRMEGLLSGTGPTFETCKLEDGAIIIICMDKPSMNWLQKTIGEMNPCNNMVMKVGEAKELIQTSKIIMKLPKIYNGLSAENI